MNRRAMHCYPDERYTDFQLSAEVIIAVAVSNDRSNQTLTCSTNAVEADPDVLVVAQSKSALPMNSNKTFGSDVTNRPATDSETAKPARDDLHHEELFWVEVLRCCCALAKTGFTSHLLALLQRGRITKG